MLGEPIKKIIQSLTSLQSHTMASTRKFCYGFLASLVLTKSTESKECTMREAAQQDDTFETDDDDREINEKIESRKSWLRQQTAITKPSAKVTAVTDRELERLMTQELRFSFES